MAITSSQLKKNLMNARRSARVELTDERRAKIRQALKDGVSKKALTIIYGITYQELKEI